MGDLSYLPFMVGRVLCALPVDSVSTVLDNPMIEPILKAPPVLSGVLNLRGNIVPIVNPFHLFNIEGTGNIVVVAELGPGKLFGILVTEVRKVISLPTPSDPHTAPTGIGIPREFLMGISISGDDWHVVLDPSQVFDLKRIFKGLA